MGSETISLFLKRLAALEAEEAGLRDRLRAQCGDAAAQGNAESLCRCAEALGLKAETAPVHNAIDGVRSSLSAPEVRAFLYPPV